MPSGRLPCPAAPTRGAAAAAAAPPGLAGSRAEAAHWHCSGTVSHGSPRGPLSVRAEPERVSRCLPVCLFQVSMPVAQYSGPDRDTSSVRYTGQTAADSAEPVSRSALRLAGPRPDSEPGPSVGDGESPGSAFSAGDRDGGVRWPWLRRKLRDHGPFRQTRTMGSASAVDRVGTGS